MSFIVKFLSFASIAIVAGMMVVIYFESKMLFALYGMSLIWLIICSWFVMIYIDSLEKQIKKLIRESREKNNK